MTEDFPWWVPIVLDLLAAILGVDQRDRLLKQLTEAADEKRAEFDAIAAAGIGDSDPFAELRSVRPVDVDPKPVGSGGAGL